MKWIKLKDRKPESPIDGEKVLICRIVNEQQSMQAIAIHDTNMVKHCEPDETWWMSLPEPPRALTNER